MIVSSLDGIIGSIFKKKVEGDKMGGPYLKTEPITAEGKDIAVKQACRLVFERFADQSLQRTWVAQHLPQRREMAELGPLLQKDETGWARNMLLGQWATELSEPEYVHAGICASGEDKVSRIFYENYWGPQERRHHEALRLVLLDSGLMTPLELHRYQLECEQSDPWTFQKQTGHDVSDIIYGVAYASAQEGQTNKTYRETRRIIWAQYGSPVDPATQRNLYPGVCGVLNAIALDEGAHQGFFLQTMLIYLRYWPDRALEALTGVFKGYNMPVVHIPNAAEFMAAVIKAKLASPRWVVTEVHNQVAKNLGLNSRKAIYAAFRNFGNLLDGENAVIQLPGKELAADEIPEGCIVYEMSTDGSFEVVEQAA